MTWERRSIQSDSAPSVSSPSVNGSGHEAVLTDQIWACWCEMRPAAQKNIQKVKREEYNRLDQKKNLLKHSHLKWKCDWCVQFRRVSASVWGNVSFFSPVVSTEWRRRVVVLKVRFIHPTNVLNTHTEFPSSPLCRSRSPTNTRNKMYIFEHKLRTFTKRKQVVFVPEPDKTEPVYYHHLDDITHLTSSFLHVQIHSNFNSKNSSLHFGTKTSRRVDFQSLTTAVWAFRTLYCSELQRWSKRIKASICQESNTLSIQKWMLKISTLSEVFITSIWLRSEHHSFKYKQFLNTPESVCLRCVSSRCRLPDWTLPGVWIWCLPPLQPDRFRLSGLLLVSNTVICSTDVCSVAVKTVKLLQRNKTGSREQTVNLPDPFLWSDRTSSEFFDQ